MNNRVAIVTGGARRIGAALVRTLHKNDFNVLLHFHRSATEAQALCDELNKLRQNSALGVCADLAEHASSEEIASAALNQWGRCDVLINNASSFYATPFTAAYTASAQDCNRQNWNTLMASNLEAPFFLAHALASTLQKNKGCIINIADIYAFKPRKDYAIYCIAKAGNAMMTKALALELAPDVRVVGIAPGSILWPEDNNQAEIINNERLKNIPLEKLGGTESICATALFLIDQGTFISGDIITVDGGQSLSS